MCYHRGAVDSNSLTEIELWSSDVDSGLFSSLLLLFPFVGTCNDRDVVNGGGGSDDWSLVF